MTVARRIFRFGPIGLIVLVLLWTAGLYPIWGRPDHDWAIFPLWLGLRFGILWHLLLVVIERPRLGYLVYALVNLTGLVALTFASSALITFGSL